MRKDYYKVAVLSRGYKRKSKGFIVADKTVTAEIIGEASIIDITNLILRFLIIMFMPYVVMGI